MVWWAREDEGVWVRACGSYRFYSDSSGRWTEIESLAYAAEGGVPPWTERGCPVYDNMVSCHDEPAARSSGGGGGSGRVRVRGYHRRDGTYVHGHTRRRPR